MHDGLVGRRVGLGDFGLYGLVERQGFHLVRSQCVAVAGRRVIGDPADVPHGSQVEHGVESRVHLVGGCLQGLGIAIVGGLPRPVHCLPEWDVDGALPSEVALTRLGQRRQRVGVRSVHFLAHVHGPCLVNQPGAHAILTDNHIELGPVVKDPEHPLVDRLAPLGVGVIFRFPSPTYDILNRVVEERVRPVEFRRIWEISGGRGTRRETLERAALRAQTGVRTGFIEQPDFRRRERLSFPDHVGQLGDFLVIRGNLLVDFPVGRRRVVAVGRSRALGLIAQAGGNVEAALLPAHHRGGGSAGRRSSTGFRSGAGVGVRTCSSTRASAGTRSSSGVGVGAGMSARA